MEMEEKEQQVLPVVMVEALLRQTVVRYFKMEVGQIQVAQVLVVQGIMELV